MKIKCVSCRYEFDNDVPISERLSGKNDFYRKIGGLPFVFYPKDGSYRCPVCNCGGRKVD